MRLLSFAAATGVAFLLTPFVIRTLGDRLYGFWTLVGTVIGYYGLLDLGLDSAVARYLASALGRGERTESSRIFGTALGIYRVVAGLVLLLSCALALASGLVARTSEDARIFCHVLLISGVSVSLMFALRAYSGVLTALIRFDISSYLELLSLALRTIFIVAALSAGFKLVGLAWVTFLAGIPSLILGVFAVRRLVPWLRYEKQALRSPTTRSLFSYSVFTLIAKVADELRFNVDKPLITAMLGLSAVTHYSIAGVLIIYFRKFLVMSMGTLQPVFSRMEAAGNQTAIRNTLFFATKLSVSLATFVGFGLIAWGRPFIVRWVGTRYLDAYPCLVVLAVGTTVALWQTPSVGLLYGISRHRFFAGANLLEGLANVILSLVLVRRYGIFGVAVGTCIPMLALKLVAQPYYVCRVSSLSLRDYAMQLCRSVAVALMAIGVPILLTRAYAGPSYVQLLTVGLGSGVSYALVIWFLQLTRQERATMLSALPSWLVPVESVPKEVDSVRRQ